MNIFIVFRIQNLVKGRTAYIVPGVMNHDDIYVSEKLNLPVLCKSLFKTLSSK
jgi:hypothetical protein